MNFSRLFYDIGWAVWALLFLVLEGLALWDRDKGDTLSEHVWAVMFDGDSPRPVVYYVVLGFVVWVFMHFAFRGRLG